MAARRGGSSVRHILPNISGQIIVVVSSAFGWAILTGTVLNFLGFGVQPPTPEWGADLAASKDWLAQGWWACTFPGVAIATAILAASYFGDACGRRSGRRWSRLAGAFPALRGCDAARRPGAGRVARRPPHDLRRAPAVLSVRDLRVAFPTPSGPLQAINGVSFDIAPREVLGVVGESGSAKASPRCRSCAVPDERAAVDGAIAFDGIDVLGMPRGELQRLRGKTSR